MRIQRSLSPFIAVVCLFSLALAPAGAAPLLDRGGPSTSPSARLIVDDTAVARPAPYSKEQGGPGVRIVVDTYDPYPALDGRCALLEAITNANADAALHADCKAGHGPDIIDLMPGTYTLTQVNESASDGENGLPSITSKITIRGFGATISRSNAAGTPGFRIFRVAPEGTLALRSLTVSNGVQEGRDKSGAGILNQGGKLRLHDVTISHNWMEFGFGAGIMSRSGELHIVRSSIVENTVTRRYGGGIYAINGKSIISSSRISNNRATSSDDGIGGVAGVYNVASIADSTMTIEDSVVSDNAVEGNDLSGGGIGNAAADGVTATLYLLRSSVTGNRATYGAGIWNTLAGANPVTAETRMFIEGSTIANNSSVSQGSGYADSGGLENFAATAVIVNSTFSGNSTAGAVYATGGAISNEALEPFPPAFVHLINSTVTNNVASHDSGGVGNLLFTAGAVAEITFANTLLAGNAAPLGANCFDGGGTLTSLGHNLDDGNSCGLSAPGDLAHADARLGLLADNGGLTLTHALLDGSAAIDAGDDAICAAPPVNAIDQRGVARPQGPACDIGAYER